MKDNILTVNKANSIFCDWGQKNELLDVEPFITTQDDKIVLSKRMKGIVEGGRGNLLRGRVQFLDRNENALTRATFAKANLKVKLFYPFLKESLVGIYNDPERILWNRSYASHFCKIEDGEIRPVIKVEAVKSFSEAETRI